MSGGGRTLEQAVEKAEGLVERNSHRLHFGKHIKMFSDGAFFSALAQLQAPGYIDEHHGEWLMPPEILEKNIRAYWHAGFQIHVHVTGDLRARAGHRCVRKNAVRTTKIQSWLYLRTFWYQYP